MAEKTIVITAEQILPGVDITKIRELAVNAKDEKTRRKAYYIQKLINDGYLNPDGSNRRPYPVAEMRADGTPDFPWAEPVDVRVAADKAKAAKVERKIKVEEKRVTERATAKADDATAANAAAWAEYERQIAQNQRDAANGQKPTYPNAKQPANPKGWKAPVQIPTPKGQQQGTQGATDTVVREYYTYEDLNALPEAQRKKLAKNLNLLGAKVPTSGVVTRSMLEAVNKFQSEFWVDLDRGFKGDQDAYMKMRLADIKSGGSGTGGSGGRGGSSTSVFMADTEFDPNQLKLAVNAAYRQAIGREATAEEIAAATKAINAGKGSTTTTTSTVNKKGQAVTSQITRPGIDQDQVIADQVKSESEYGSYQSATTYFDAMLSALNGPVGRGF